MEIPGATELRPATVASVSPTWRPLSTSDVGAWADLIGASSAADGTDTHYSEAELAEMLADDLLDPEHGTVALFEGNLLVAAGVAWPGAAPVDVHEVRVHATVHPLHRGRGIGRELLDRLLRCARWLHQNRRLGLPLEVYSSVPDGNIRHEALVRRFGFQPARWFCVMRRELADLPEPTPAPDGLRLVPYRDELDDAVRLAFNESFADHWGETEQTPQSWKDSFTGSRAFLPALSFLLIDEQTGDGSDDVAAFTLNRFHEGHAAATGVREIHIGDLGTRRPWRGRGAASALLTHTMAAASAEGYQRVSLAVDADNPSGALGLYQRYGFAITDRWTTYVLRAG